MNPTLSDVKKFLQSEEQKKPTLGHYGVVAAEIKDGDEVIGYEVDLGGDNTIECGRYIGAQVGDVVLVTLMDDGSVEITNRRGGDKDAKDAWDYADDAARAATVAWNHADDAGIAASNAQASANQAQASADAAGTAASSAQAAADAAIEANYKKYNKVSWTDAEIGTKCIHGYQDTWARHVPQAGDTELFYLGAVSQGDILVIYVIQSEHSNKVSKLLVEADADTAQGVAVHGTVISYDENIGAYFWHDSEGAHVANIDGTRADLDGRSISFVSNGENVASFGVEGVKIGNDENYVQISNDAVAMMGSSSKLSLADGELKASYNGTPFVTMRSGDSDRSSYLFSINLLKGQSQTFSVPSIGTPLQVIVKVKLQKVFSASYDYWVLGPTGNLRYSYINYNDYTDITLIHNYDPGGLWSLIVEQVQFKMLYSGEIFNLGNGALKLGAAGNMEINNLWIKQVEVTSGNPNVFLDPVSAIPGQIFRSNSSSRKVKHDIKPVEDIDCHALYDIDVVQFKFNEDYLYEKDERFGKDIVGFIAEQVDEVFPIGVDHGETPMWNAQIMFPAALKLIQEQHEEIEQLKEVVNGLLKTRMEE